MNDDALAEQIVADELGADAPLDLGDTEDVSELWEAVERHAEADRRTDTDETTLDERWSDTLPVGVMFLADWHIGSKWVDYAMLGRFADELAAWRTRHPGALRVAFLGDGSDGYLPNMGRVSGGMMEETVTNLDKQDRLFVHVMQRAGGADYITLGCHWAWLLTYGRNPLREIAREIGARDMGFGFCIRAGVGGQSYTVIGRHRALGISRLNTTNVHRSLYTMYEAPGHDRADVIALAHNHVNNLHRQGYAGKQTVWLSAGGAKGADCFARSLSLRHSKEGADFGAPLVVFYPDEHRMIPFYGRDWRIGLQFLAFERARYAAMPAP